MNTKLFLIAGVLVMFPVLLFAQLTVSNNPTGAAVVVTQSSAVFVTWTVQSSNPQQDTVVSEEGLFVLGDRTLGRVSTFLTTSVTGSGSASETLLIPPDVANAALKLNAPTFFYKRTFRSTSSGATGQSALTCRLSTSAYGNFSIAAVTLLFDNKRGEETFEQNDSRARAVAEVRFNGTGLLRAVWEVLEPGSSGFRTLQQVNYHITYGDRIVFETPAVPPIPTVITGRHTLRFRITQPVSGFELPSVTYFVKASEQQKRLASIALQNPASGISLNSGTEFSWNKSPDVSVLKFSVYEKGALDTILPADPATNAVPEKKEAAGSRLLHNPDIFLSKGVEVFSAALQTNARSFIPREEQVRRLRPGTWYVWQIQALDATGKLIAESELRTFQVREQTQTQP